MAGMVYDGEYTCKQIGKINWRGSRMRQMQKEKLLPEQTAEKIREYIESNGMKTGDKLPNEFQLAEICGVGRSTIREAIKLLVFSGKVEVIRGSGTYI